MYGLSGVFVGEERLAEVEQRRRVGEDEPSRQMIPITAFGRQHFPQVGS